MTIKTIILSCIYVYVVIKAQDSAVVPGKNAVKKEVFGHILKADRSRYPGRGPKISNLTSDGRTRLVVGFLIGAPLVVVNPLKLVCKGCEGKHHREMEGRRSNGNNDQLKKVRFQACSSSCF